LLGTARLGIGDRDGARREFGEAVRLNPAYVQAHCHLGKVEILSGNFGEAVLHLTRALELDPGLADIHCLLGEAWIEQGNLVEGEAALDRALERNPEYVDALLARAVLCRRLGRDPEARRLCHRVLELRPGHPMALAGLGRATGPREGNAREG
jgi:Flp pilus assembly protein TadD